MSVEELNAELQPESGKALNDEKSNVDGGLESKFEQLQAQLNALTSTNDRLLDESKRNKVKARNYDALSGELEKLKTEKLESEGNVQQLLENERERVKALSSKLEQADSRVLNSNILESLKRLAPDVRDARDLLKDEYGDVLKAGLSEDSLNVSDDSIKDLIELNRKNSPHYFGNKKVASFGDGAPMEQKEKSLKDITFMEKSNLLGKLLSK